MPAAGGGWTDAGLVGTYYADATFTSAAFTRKDQRIDFQWGTVARPGGSISPGFRAVGADNYSVRWTGQLVPRYTEAYTFSGTADDTFVLELKKATDATWTTVVNQSRAAAGFTGTMPLRAGQAYDVRISYQEFSGGSTARLRWASPSTPVEVIDTLTQSGINNPDSQAAFVDLVKANTRNAWGGVAGQPAPAMDANGWPTGDGTFGFQESLKQGLGLDPLMRGRLTFRFTGKATVSLYGNVDHASLTYAYDPSTNATTGSFRTVDKRSNASWVAFQNTSRTGQPGGPGGITDYQLLRPAAPDAAATYPAGTVFTDQIKDAMGRFNVIRFQYVANQQKEWSDRTRPGYFNQHGGTRTAPTYPLSWDTTSNNGWSWEHKVLLANETGRDLMLSLPPLASGRTGADSQSYLVKLANLLKYGSNGVDPYTAPQANPVYPPLNPNLRVYLELGNELWNWGGVFYSDFNNLNQLTAAAVRAGGDDYRAINYDDRPTTTNANGEYTSINTWRTRMAALRMVQASNIFRSVFGDAAMPGTGSDPRVRPLYEWQYANANGTASNPLVFLDNYFNNGDGKAHVATPRPVSYYLWGGGGAAYYGATNGNGLTELLPNPGFDAADVPAGYTTAPAGASWSFAGTAGVARDGGAGDDIPAAFNGGQVGYVAGTGRMTATFTVPASHTSDVYAVAFKALNRKKVGAAAADAQNLRVYLDYGTSAQVDITARTFSQRNGYTPPDFAGMGNTWNARNVSWQQSQYYYTKTFQLPAGSTHTITIVGTRADDQAAFLDDVRVTSVDAIYAGGMPAGGEAAGQPAGQRIRESMSKSADWANAYGLRHVAYESGWSLGGDDGGSPLQLAAKYGDPRTADVQGQFMDFYHEAGGDVNVFGTYAQWPSWADFYAEQGLQDVAKYPIVRGIRNQANRLPNAPTNGTAVAPSGATTVAPADSLSNTWSAPNGARLAPGNRSTAGYTLLVEKAGRYTLTAALANPATGGRVRVMVDGQPVGVLTVPRTGSWTAFGASPPLVVDLPAGRHVVLLTALTPSPAGYAAGVGDLTLTAPAAGQVPPASPSGLRATAASDTRVDLTWADRSGNEVGFVVERATTSNFLSPTRFAVGANATGFADTGLTPGTTYYYRVLAANAGGQSAQSAAASVTTAAGATVLRYEFTGLVGNEASAPITAADPGVAVSAITRGPGLKPTSPVRVLTVPDRFGSEAADTWYGATLADAVAKGQYYQFTVTPAAGRALNLSSLTFTPYFGSAAATPDPRGAAITYSTDGVTFGPGVVTDGSPSSHGWAYTALLARRADLQNLAGPLTVRIYLYGVGRGGLTGLGGTGDDIRLAGEVVAAAGTTAAPNAPTGLTATARADGRVDLAWTDNCSREAGFVVERATTPDFAGAAEFTVGANVTACTDAGLTPGATYYYRVRATNAGGESAPTNTATAAVPAAGPVGYTFAAAEGKTVTFAEPVDLAYGADGRFVYRYNVTGPVTFANAAFGDPAPGKAKAGFARPAAGGTGLAVTYYDNMDLTAPVVTRVDPTVDFNWGRGSPAAAVGADTFSGRWTGRVQAVETGAYLFRTISDAGVRLWVDGKVVIDAWTPHAARADTSAAITLTAGRKYDIRLEYYERIELATMRLQWQRPDQVGFAAIPAVQLYPTSPAKLTGTAIGIAGATGTGREKAFDGDAKTYFAAPTTAAVWVGLDLGAATSLTQVRFAPRAGYGAGMVGGVFQASNTADFSSGVVDLYKVKAAPPDGTTTAAVAPPGTYRYVRYLAPVGSAGNLAEFEVFGLRS